MKNNLLTKLVSTVSLMVLVWASSPAQAAIPIEHWKQADGAAVWLVPSMSIPMVEIKIEFDAGSRRDPKGKAGLAEVTASLMQSGVMAWHQQPAMDKITLSEAWADLGAGFGVETEMDSFSIGLRSLTYDDVLPKAIALATQQIAAPAFDEAAVKEERERILIRFNNFRSQPSYLAEEAFTQTLFGSHPYGQLTTEQSLQAIKVEDVQAFHRDRLKPCHARVTIVGAVQRPQAEKLVSELLSGLPSTSSECPELKPIADPEKLTAAVRKDIPMETEQAHILIGQLAIKPTDPDYFPLLVGNYILGDGGFVSHLMQEVREKNGLTYSISSYFATKKNTGEFKINFETRPDQAQQALEMTMKVLRDFIQNGPTDEELQTAKSNLINGFALRLNSNARLLANLVKIARYDLPLDYLETWQQKVAAVTKEEIHQAFKNKLQPDKMVTVVLGGKDAQ